MHKPVILYVDNWPLVVTCICGAILGVFLSGYLAGALVALHAGFKELIG